MSHDSHLTLGLDFGTSGVRGCVVTERQESLGVYRVATRLSHRSQAGHHQQDPQAWAEALWALFDQIPVDMRAHLNQIILDATSSTVLLCDAQSPNRPLTPALMYDDRRAEIEAQKLAQLFDHDPTLSAALGATSTLSKVLWLQKRLPPNTTAKVCHQIDYLNGLLTGVFDVTDENNALKLGYDAQKRVWPDVVKRYVTAQLPQVKPAGTFLANLSQETAKKCQIPQSCRVFTGTTDSIAGFLATGASQVGEACTSLGSTLAIKLLSDTPISDPKMGVYSHRLGDRWLVGGASNSGGAVLLHFFVLEALKTLSEQCANDPPRLPDLHYYPLVTAGERFPIADPHFDPKVSPRPASDKDFLWQLLKGLVQIEKLGYQTLEALGAPPVQTVYTVGGGTQNLAWQLLRNKELGACIKKPLHNEAAFGVTQLLS